MATNTPKTRRLHPLHIVLAIVVTLVLNIGGMILMSGLKDTSPPPVTGEVGKVTTFEVQAPREKRRPPAEKRSRQRVTKTQVSAVAPPNLPSSIQSPALLAAALDLSDMIGSELQDSSGPDELIMSEKTVDEPPRAIRKPAALYPQDAADQGIQGYVQLRLLVNRDGIVKKVHVEKAAPAGVFEEAARQAAIRWSFSPAMFEGQPVSVWVRQRMIFSLDDGGL